VRDGERRRKGGREGGGRNREGGRAGERERGGKKGGERERERERESSSVPLALTQRKEAGETATLGLPVAFQFS